MNNDVNEIIENFQYQLYNSDREPESIISGYLTNGLIKDKKILQQVLDQVKEQNKFEISIDTFDRFFVSEE